MYPVTTGGRISGIRTRPLSRDWPQKRPRANAIAIAMPNGRLRRVATMATLRLSWIAVHSSGLRVIQSIGVDLSSSNTCEETDVLRASGPKHREPLRLKQGL